MLKKLQLVIAGVVVLHAANMGASENKSQISPKTPRTPRSPLSCSKEARNDSGDFPVLTGLKQSLEKRKEGTKPAENMYYDSPCGTGRIRMRHEHDSNVSPMAPWGPDYYI